MKHKKNKLILIFIFLISTVSGQNLNLKKYETYLKTLDLNKYYSTTIATNKYKELFSLEKTVIKDSAFVCFKKFYDNVTIKLNELHVNDDTDYEILFYDSNIHKNIVIPQIVLNYRKDLIDNGFDIAIDEGRTWINQDWNFISKNFYTYISSNMKEYCTFLNLVIREGTEEDGAFKISATRLAERIIWIEKFKNLNNEFILINECNSHYKYFLYLLLTGTDHTSIKNGNNEISQNFKDAYNFITLENPNSKTAKLVLPFYQFLNNNENSKAYDLVGKYKKEGIIVY